jgi:predicted amidophosphoribosyltransferase
VLTPLKELLFPVHCFGCKQLGIEICSQCRRYWNPHFYIQKIDGLSIYSSIRYSSVAKSILLSAKEDSIKIADELIISALTNCIKRLPTQVLRSCILMPIPGSKRAIRKRGRDFIYELTKEVSLRTGLPCISGMEVTRTLLDQSGLSAIDRRRNIAGAFKASIQSTEQDLILVDDLVTTGATLLEAKRALLTNGITVSRAITACVAQAPTIRG